MSQRPEYMEKQYTENRIVQCQAELATDRMQKSKGKSNRESQTKPSQKLAVDKGTRVNPKRILRRPSQVK